MHLDQLRRLPLSRSNAYVLLSILIVVTQVVFRVLLFYVDNAQSGDTSLRLPQKSLFDNFAALESNSNTTLSVLESLSPSSLLFHPSTRLEIEVCADTRGPCQTFSIDQIASSNSTLDFCSFVKSYAADLYVPFASDQGFHFPAYLRRFRRFRENRLEDAAFIGIHLYLLFVTVYAVRRPTSSRRSF